MYPHKLMNAKSVVFLISASTLLIYTFSHNFNENNFYRIDKVLNFDVRKAKNREPIYAYNGSEDFLLNTKGCYIPNYGKTLHFKEPKINKKNCGEQAIFTRKTENNTVLDFRIDKKIMNKYSKNKTVDCYYNFGRRSTTAGLESTKLSYTEWRPFEDGTNVPLQEEVITVKCDARTPDKKKSVTVYEDAYVFIKKFETKKPKAKEKTWNVLIVGMDTMSRERLLSSMPKTAKYFQDYGWLDYRGYHKVGYNTFPNLMAFLTGKKMETIYQRCTRSLYDCNDLFIWSMFRDAGYMTAYGEDNLKLPDTFSRYNGFRINPTHHYIRPFLLTGEKLTGNLICAHHQPSAIHVLNYAYDFTNAYKKEKFFGTFWINSYSHNLENNPQLLDKAIVGFFERLNENEALNNTIVLFTSDHGIRFGRMRIPVESYYEERLPMLFVWIPHGFRKLHDQKHYNLQLNQNRLVTPYDVYLTLAEISNNFKTFNVVSEACPQCSSLFVEKSTYRTCEDASISEKWCSCHSMTKADLKDTATSKSIHVAVKFIQDLAKSIKTTTSKGCRPTRLKNVIRAHSYISSGNKTHYVIAWRMTPGGMAYEATVAKDGNNFTVLQPTHGMGSYESKQGHCVKNSNDREFCVC